jgi:DNA excision repair protein ERCC-2
MTDLSVTVGQLAQFCHRSGDIDYRFRPSPTASQGIEGHQRVYRKRPDSYLREYPVDCQWSDSLQIRGRADGYDPKRALIEEIKTCRVHPDTIPEPISRLHMAQARLYAAMVNAVEKHPQMEVRLTWLNIDDDSEYTLEQSYTAQELTDFFNDTMARFSHWWSAITRLRAARDDSLAELVFPHPEFRAGQRELAELVYKCIDQRGELLLEAPTGIGKTAAVLYPALKALATDKHDKLLFLTARSVGRKTAEDSLDLLAGAGYKGCALSLTAKDVICLSPGKACHGDDCPYARGYYDKLPDAMLAALEFNVLRRENLEQLARRFEVCPYQLGLDLLPWMDVVIGDLHHFYGLPALTTHLLEQGQDRWSALVDEAHNLPGRARGMYSAELAKGRLMAARKSASSPLSSSLNRLNKVMLDLQKEDWHEPEFDSQQELPPGLLEALKLFIADCADAQARDAAVLHRSSQLLAFYHDVLHFIRVAECWGQDFRFERMRGAEQQSLRLRLNCLDPARLLGQRHERLHSLTAFSATLSPAEWMRSSLGFSEQAVYRRQDSPFSPGQMQVSVATHIDTRYRGRSESMPELARVLAAWLADTAGNCIVYFPSYKYLQDCLALLDQLPEVLASRTLWIQGRDQNQQSRDELLDQLEVRRDLAAFCILGGVFGEGIDLPGDRLRSVVVVGVGLPQVNRDSEQQRQYFASRYGSGYEYAYIYPGMQKVDQALGRVIRRLDDRGSALIIDPRYRQSEYRDLLPPWWAYRDYSGAEN